MTRKKIFFFVSLLPAFLFGQNKTTTIDAKYAEGTVPIVNGMVIFSDTCQVPGKTKEQIYDSLYHYAISLVQDKEALPQTRINLSDPKEGLISVRIEEWLYFKNTAWITDRARISYQLILKAEEGSFEIEMRRINYVYGEEDVPGGIAYNAETWITDETAINTKKKMFNNEQGKFRIGTINRKEELFRKAREVVSDRPTNQRRPIVNAWRTAP